MKNPIVKVFILLASWLFISAQSAVIASEKPFAIAIHGGAGNMNQAAMSAERQAEYKAKLQEAVNAGYDLLEQGESSQSAIIAAIQILEESTLFNAGRGAVYTFEGEHELDASIMDGKSLNAGAVSGVKIVKSPILLAQKVMLESVHVMLSGAGAEAFAREQKLTLVDNSYFNTKRRFESLQKAKKSLIEKQSTAMTFQQAHRQLDVNYKMGTVGAVALDKNGNLAAGTSTGGMTAKRYGRVGDAPIIGAGTYANNQSCAVSATGHGEYFIRYHVAADICARMQYQGVTLQQASEQVINSVLVEAGGAGGVISIDPKGNISMPFNTTGMHRASRSSNGEQYVGIFKDK